MKKISALILILVLVMFVFYFRSGNNKPSEKKTISTKSIEQKVPSISTRVPAKVESFKTEVIKTKEENPTQLLENFNRKKIEWIKGNLFLVEGICATHKKDPLIEPIIMKNGFYFYDSSLVQGSEVIFNPKKNKYGVFSKEITFKGNPISISNLLKSTAWEILYQNELLRTVIVKVEKVEDAALLIELKDSSDLEWKPGIIYSRPSRK